MKFNFNNFCKAIILGSQEKIETEINILLNDLNHDKSEMKSHLNNVLKILILEKKYQEVIIKSLNQLSYRIINESQYLELIGISLINNPKGKGDERIAIELLNKYEKENYDLSELHDSTLPLLEFAFLMECAEVLDWFYKRINIYRTFKLNVLDDLSFFNKLKNKGIKIDVNLHLDKLSNDKESEVVITYFQCYPEELEEQLYQKTEITLPGTAHHIQGNITHIALATNNLKLMEYLLSRDITLDDYQDKNDHFPFYNLIASEAMINLLKKHELNIPPLNWPEKLIQICSGEVGDKNHPYGDYESRIIFFSRAHLSLLCSINDVMKISPAMFKDIQRLNKLTFFEDMVDLVILHKLENIIDFLLNNYSKYLKAYRLFLIVCFYCQTDHQSQLNKVISIIQATLNQVEKESLLKEITTRFIYGFPTSSTNKIIQELFNDTNIEIDCDKIVSPEIAAQLLQHNKKIIFSEDHLLKLLLISKINGDSQSFAILSSHTQNTLPTLKWNYTKHSQNRSVIKISEEKRAMLYGREASQEQYRCWFNQCVDIILADMLFGCFKMLSSTDVMNKRVLGNFDADPLFKSAIIEKETLAHGSTLKRIGELRGWMAMMAGSPNEKEFGKPRTYSFVTPIVGQYRVYYDKLLSRSTQETELVLEDAEYIMTHTGIGLRGQISIDIDGKKIPLTSYKEIKNFPFWVHTDASHINLLNQHIDRLIKNILEKTVDHAHPEEIKQLTKDIGYVHWLSAHACDFERGSAAITEMMCKALFRFHGLEITWTSLLDCEALIALKPEQYADQYAQYIDIKMLDPIENTPTYPGFKN